MPSIFSHLIFAQDALEAQPMGSLRLILEEHLETYFLGSLCPDLPYFDIFHSYRGLPLGAVFSPVSHTVETRILAWLGWSMPEEAGWSLRMHSVGTPAILEAWTRHAWRRLGPLVALCAGMMTHCAVDEVLHPKINADSGEWTTAEGMRRHRELEINLDYVLLRGRGVVIESLSLGGFLEVLLGRVGQNGEYLCPSLKHEWIAASAACDGERALRRGELDAWSRGFAGAMRLLDHALSPMQQQKRRFLDGGEERWRTFFARERYLSSHVLQAGRAAEAALERLGRLDGPSKVGISSAGLPV